MKTKPSGYYSFERCLESARKHSSRGAWYASDPSALRAAATHGWTKECTAHMTRLRAATRGGGHPDSFKKMKAMMPRRVRFGRDQKWLGTNIPHVFVDSKLGQFTAIPKNLMQQSWPKGLSGHTDNSKLASRGRRYPKDHGQPKPVVCIQTGKEYGSAQLASLALGYHKNSLGNAIAKGLPLGGLTYAYKGAQ